MIVERYIAATTATSLHEDANVITQVDVIKASGMSERNIASHYLRLISKPSRGDIERVHAALEYVAISRKLKDGLEQVTPAVDWLINQACRPCNGTGIDAKKGGSFKCKRCNGTGERLEPSHPAAQILIDYVKDCKNAYGSRMLQKLR